MGIGVKRLAWMGTRTDKVAETSAFLEHVIGLERAGEEPGFVMFRLPGTDHDYVEVFGADREDAALYTTGPVVGLLVDDLVRAREVLDSEGVELLDEITWAGTIPGYGWFHFRGPDGSVYACLQGSHVLPQ